MNEKLRENIEQMHYLLNWIDDTLDVMKKDKQLVKALKKFSYHLRIEVLDTTDNINALELEE